MSERADDRGDAFAETAGAYVLGSLDAGERAAFEAHLAGCPACRAAVDDVAHLPALLAAVPPGGLADPPPSLLPGLLSGVVNEIESAEAGRDEVGQRRASRRRRMWTGGGLVGAAAAGFLAGALVLPQADGGDPGPGDAVTTVALAATGVAPVEASVDLEPVPWGTRLVVTCTYDGGGVGADQYAGPAARAVEYALVVRDAEGNMQQVATWLAVPGRDVTVPAATSLDVAEIAELQMMSGGEVVLSAQV